MENAIHQKTFLFAALTGFFFMVYRNPLLKNVRTHFPRNHLYVSEIVLAFKA